MLVCGRQIEALWVLSKPISVLILAILAHVGVCQADGGTLGAF
jgi:hypothetical protein